jgi:hypothetical protein
MSEPVYCLLITGKDKDRYKFVPLAIDNFIQQTYQNKFLLIINHGNESLKKYESSNIKEVMFNKKHMNLGDMRNFSLEMVPLGALFTLWDDDDWRHTKYIELLVKNMKEFNADVVFFKNRLDYNANTKFIYRARFKKGTPFILARKFDTFKYLSKDSLEDVRLHNDFELYRKSILIINNDPRWYIRTIHGKNTSLYVDSKKKTIVNYSDESSYHEFDATEKEKSYVKKIIEIYYNGKRYGKPIFS